MIEADPEAGWAVWERVKAAAFDELASGHRAALAVCWGDSPWQRAQFLAIRQAFVDEWLAQPLFATGQLSVRGAAWYAKPQATFSDTIASVRRCLWSHEHFSTSLYELDMIRIPRSLLDRFIDSLCYAA